MLLWDQTYVIDTNDVHLVLEAASMLQFTDIKRACEERITNVLDPSICLRIWNITELLDIKSLYLKAKTMALEEFPTISKSKAILELNLRDLCAYLGNIYLNVDEEFTVFQTAMDWYYDKENSQDMEPTEVLKILLTCVNFNNLKLNQIAEMKAYPGICDNNEILSVIDSFVNTKIDSNEVVPVSAPNSTYRTPCSIPHFRNRELPIAPCILFQSISRISNEADLVAKKCKKTEKCVVIYDNFGRTRILTRYVPDETDSDCSKDLSGLFYDTSKEKFKYLFKINEDKIKDLAGFKLLSYKELILLIGGEYLIGGGNWNCNVWSYNTFKEKWQRKCVLPCGRRHFEAIIANDSLYIIGGFGRFRVLQDNLMCYDFKKKKWSPLYPLPNGGRQFKCCTFNGTLVLVYLVDKKAFLFNKEYTNWSSVNINIDQKIVDNIGSHSVFCDSRYFYVKGKTLLRFQWVKNSLKLDLQKDVLDMEYEEIECVLCNRNVFTLYKSLDEHYSSCYTFEKMNLDTFQVTTIFKKQIEGLEGGLEADGRSFCPTPKSKLFTLNCYYLNEDSVYVNSAVS